MVTQNPAETAPQVDEPTPQSPVARGFVEALKKAEASGDLEPLVATFAEDAELSRMTQDHAEQGQQGARHFWQTYLAQFGVIRSTFTRVTEANGTAVLEWVSEGTLAKAPGKEEGMETPIRYRGVSILELGGEKVSKFRTYYDSAAFTALGTKVAGGEPADEPPAAG